MVTRQQGQIIWPIPSDYKGPIAKPVASLALNTKSADPNRKICRPQATTGSLIASTRICPTRAEWQMQYLHAQEETRNMHPRFQPGN